MTRHDCVVIPGWGAFIANCSPARYDADREVMERPHRSIGFNASVSHNDGLLAQSLLRREGMDYDEAMRFIADTSSRIPLSLTILPMKIKTNSSSRRPRPWRISFLLFPTDSMEK